MPVNTSEYPLSLRVLPKMSVLIDGRFAQQARSNLVRSDLTNVGHEFYVLLEQCSKAKFTNPNLSFTAGNNIPELNLLNLTS